jgi:hypothetical protein
MDWDGSVMVGIGRSMGDCRAGCTAVSLSSDSPDIVLLEVDAAGRISRVRRHEDGELVWASIRSTYFTEGGAWERCSNLPRLVALFPGSVVAVHVLRRYDDASYGNCISIVSLYSLEEQEKGSDCRNHLKAFESCRIVTIQRMRDDYLLLLCRERNSELDPPGQYREQACAIILHVPTLQVITRVCLPWLISQMPVVGSGSILAVGPDSRGVVMTGRDVRAVNDSGLVTNPTDGAASELNDEKKKKKKMRPPIGSGKKDGFARGMRQSG